MIQVGSSILPSRSRAHYDKRYELHKLQRNPLRRSSATTLRRSGVSSHTFYEYGQCAFLAIFAVNFTDLTFLSKIKRISKIKKLKDDRERSSHQVIKLDFV